jgi:hypothetical protein
MSRPKALPGDIAVVCVETGKRTKVAREKLTTLPGLNERTGRKTFVPYVVRNGSAVVEKRFEELVISLNELNLFVDPQTLEVKDEP